MTENFKKKRTTILPMVGIFETHLILINCSVVSESIMEGILRRIPLDIIIEIEQWLDSDDLSIIYETGDKLVLSRFASITGKISCLFGSTSSYMPLNYLMKSPRMKKIEYADVPGRKTEITIDPSFIATLSQNLTHLSLQAEAILETFRTTFNIASSPFFPLLTHLTLRDTFGSNTIIDNGGIIPFAWPESIVCLKIEFSSKNMMLDNLPPALTELSVYGWFGLIEFQNNVLPPKLKRLQISRTVRSIIGSESDGNLCDLSISDEGLKNMIHLDAAKCDFLYFNIIRMPLLESINCEDLILNPAMSVTHRIDSKLKSIRTSRLYDGENIVRTIPAGIEHFGCSSSLNTILLLPNSYSGHYTCSDQNIVLVGGQHYIPPPLTSIWIDEFEPYLVPLLPASLTKLSIWDYEGIYLQYIPPSVTYLEIASCSSGDLSLVHIPQTVTSLYWKHGDCDIHPFIPESITKLQIRCDMWLSIKLMREKIKNWPSSITDIKFAINIANYSKENNLVWPTNLRSMHCFIGTNDFGCLKLFLADLPITLTSLTLQDDIIFKPRKSWIAHLVNLK